MSVNRLRSLCDAAVPAPGGRFSMPQLMGWIAGTDAVVGTLPNLQLSTSLSVTLQRRLGGAILRQAFFIEPVVLPGATTTRYKTRWAIDRTDPRFAEVDECLAIAETVAELLRRLAATEEGRLILASFGKDSMVSHELPIDYRERLDPIHRATNVKLIDQDVIREVAGLRLLLLDERNTHRIEIGKIYRDKIAIKTYLTDRVLTGSHLTNREKRWEAHPDSVQFAHRTACLGIERVLINLLCRFEGFPPRLRQLLEEGRLLRGNGSDEPSRCPVTLDPFSYEALVSEVTSPAHGKSRFQVGHLDPLKLTGNTWNDGHSPGNIGWLSDDGNRIQGSMSVEETRKMLSRIWGAYKEAGLLPVH